MAIAEEKTEEKTRGSQATDETFITTGSNGQTEFAILEVLPDEESTPSSAATLKGLPPFVIGNATPPLQVETQTHLSLNESRIYSELAQRVRSRLPSTLDDGVPLAVGVAANSPADKVTSPKKDRTRHVQGVPKAQPNWTYRGRLTPLPGGGYLLVDKTNGKRVGFSVNMFEHAGVNLAELAPGKVVSIQINETGSIARVSSDEGLKTDAGIAPQKTPEKLRARTPAYPEVLDVANDVTVPDLQEVLDGTGTNSSGADAPARSPVPPKELVSPTRNRSYRLVIVRADTGALRAFIPSTNQYFSEDSLKNLGIDVSKLQSGSEYQFMQRKDDTVTGSLPMLAAQTPKRFERNSIEQSVANSSEKRLRLSKTVGAGPESPVSPKDLAENFAALGRDLVSKLENGSADVSQLHPIGSPTLRVRSPAQLQSHEPLKLQALSTSKYGPGQLVVGAPLHLPQLQYLGSVQRTTLNKERRHVPGERSSSFEYDVAKQLPGKIFYFPQGTFSELGITAPVSRALASNADKGSRHDLTVALGRNGALQFASQRSAVPEQTGLRVQRSTQSFNQKTSQAALSAQAAQPKRSPDLPRNLDGVGFLGSTEAWKSRSSAMQSYFAGPSPRIPPVSMNEGFLRPTEASARKQYPAGPAKSAQFEAGPSPKTSKPVVHGGYMHLIDVANTNGKIQGPFLSVREAGGRQCVIIKNELAGVSGVPRGIVAVPWDALGTKDREVLRKGSKVTVSLSNARATVKNVLAKQPCFLGMSGR